MRAAQITCYDGPEAVESVGGFLANADRNAGLSGERASWRYIYEVWMVPEDVSNVRAA